MSEVKRIDEHLARLKGRLAHGGMTYEGAVACDELVSILTEIRWRLVEPRFRSPVGAVDRYTTSRADTMMLGASMSRWGGVRTSTRDRNHRNESKR